MPTAPYDLVMTVVNAVKVRLNDEITTLDPIGAKFLKNGQYFTLQTANNAWRKLQQFLFDLGYGSLKQETLFTNVPPAATVDPASQMCLSFTDFWDGVTHQAAPVLPQNLITPYDLWERKTGSGALLTEMDLVLNGLPAVTKAQWNRRWEWRNNAIYLPGATVATDIRLRYGGFFLDFADVGAVAGANQLANAPWYAQPVPILSCADSLADYCCREISVARGDMEGAAAFQASAEVNARLILNRDTAAPKSILKASEYGKMQDRHTPPQGADTQPVKR